MLSNKISDRYSEVLPPMPSPKEQQKSTNTAHLNQKEWEDMS